MNTAWRSLLKTTHVRTHIKFFVETRFHVVLADLELAMYNLRCLEICL